MSAPLIEAAIASIRDLIVDGSLLPGDRLPAEQELATQLGLSRNTTREAVRALVTVKVLDVRRGDGTFVTSLTPELLLEGIGFVVELMQEDRVMELVEARRILEPQITALAAVRATDGERTAMAGHLRAMERAEDQEELVAHDAAFHAAVARAAGNATLASILIGISSVTLRARVWRGLIEDQAHERTIAEHGAILAAIEARDPALAQAAGAAPCVHHALLAEVPGAGRDGLTVRH